MAENDDRIYIRVPTDLKAAYLEYCDSIGTTYSDDLRRYITACVNKSKAASK